MRANNKLLKDFIEQKDIWFYIPVYQRNYNWKREQCECLLNDIEKAAETEKEHFTGSFVYTEEANKENLTIKLTIIDEPTKTDNDDTHLHRYLSNSQRNYHKQIR